MVSGMKTFTEFLTEMAQTAQDGSIIAKRGFKFEDDLKKAYCILPDRPKGFRNISKDMDELVKRVTNHTGHNIISIKPNQIVKTTERGLPKADISFIYTFDDGSTEVFSFSLKTTAARKVSVHQSTPEQFIQNVLGSLPSDTAEYKILQQGLKEFGTVGSWKTVKVWDPAQLETFKKSLEMIIPNIADYVLCRGNGGTKADAVVIFNPVERKYTVATDAEYMDLCRTTMKSIKGIGGLFSYTYPHGKRGQQIQLKMPVICQKSMD